MSMNDKLLEIDGQQRRLMNNTVIGTHRCLLALSLVLAWQLEEAKKLRKRHMGCYSNEEYAYWLMTIIDLL